MVMGLLVLVAPDTAAPALVLFLAISFALDGARLRRRRRGASRDGSARSPGSRRPPTSPPRRRCSCCATPPTPRSIAVAAALRLFGIAWAMAVTPVHTAEDAGRHGHRRPRARPIAPKRRPARAASPRKSACARRATAAGRSPSWSRSLRSTSRACRPTARCSATRRRRSRWSATCVLALLFALRRRRAARRSRCAARRAGSSGRCGSGTCRPGSAPAAGRGAVAGAWLRYRLRSAIRLREARFSIPAALWRSLAVGLPIAAVVAATVPVWGMSWFFDTENWASGIWNSWAEARTDVWREAMVRAVPAERIGRRRSPSPPPGTATGDFCFIVIGDTGEGDASQHVLRDQLLTVAGGRRRPVRRHLARTSSTPTAR